MYKRQQGFLPFIFRFGGLAFISFSIIRFVEWFPRALLLQKVRNTDPILALLTDVPIFLIIGLLLLNVFPDIRLTSDGLKFRTGPIPLYFLIRWGEMESVVQMKHEIIRIAIKRSGFFIFNGLFFQGFIGLFLQHEYPLLLLSPGLDRRDEIVQEILTYSNVKKIKLVRDVYT
ncbi:MAG: hypothetical protein QY329_12770 [Anaerolineales bacterium]|nr:MAG: hypothetical protein QY329_12760 [Anaerolineales bacterium]WKZ50326.1 MAG: hypothetical protein QY329_12770 [Anaerolineales bacterium]